MLMVLRNGYTLVRDSGGYSSGVYIANTTSTENGTYGLLQQLTARQLEFRTQGQKSSNATWQFLSRDELFFPGVEYGSTQKADRIIGTLKSGGTILLEVVDRELFGSTDGRIPSAATYNWRYMLTEINENYDGVTVT